MCDSCLKLAIKTPEQSHWCRSSFFIVIFEEVPLTACVAIADFEMSAER